jgi:Malate/L-lactate dehydrogenase
MEPDEALARLRALGFAEDDAQRLFAHFSEAEARGKRSHGFSRVEWLETLELDPSARPERIESEPGFERWHGRGALGYLVLDAVVHAQLGSPPAAARVIVCEDTFPTGMLGGWVRRLAEGGLVAALTATSPARLAHPDGGPALIGTTPLAIGIPSSGGDPIVTDVSMGAVTHGDVLAGLARPEELVPFGGEQAHKAFALGLGLQLLVQALHREDGFGAVLVVARPGSDPVPGLRALAAGVRLPGNGSDVRAEVRRLAGDAADREEARVIREQLEGLRPSASE